MTKSEMTNYEAMLAARRRRLVDDLDHTVEVLVDGDYVEVTAIPVSADTCQEEYCDCPGYHTDIDTDALEAFPEILAAVLAADEAAAGWAAADRAQRRAESGYAQ